MFKIQPSGHKDLILTWPERGVLHDDFFDVVLLEEERRKHVDDASAERRQDEEDVRQSLHCGKRFVNDYCTAAG